jgi:hypothetical protein
VAEYMRRGLKDGVSGKASLERPVAATVDGAAAEAAHSRV